MRETLETNRSVARQVDDREYRIFIESVNDYAIYLLDPEGFITTWNAGAERFKGYRPEEAIGRNYAIFHTAEEQASEQPRRALEIAARDGRFETEGWRVRNDGSPFWASVVLDPIYEAGQIVGYANVTRDISTQKNAMAGQAVFDHSVDVICTITKEGLFKQVGKQAAVVWGYSPEELIGTPFIDFVHPDDREATLATNYQIVNESKPVQAFRNRYIHKNGSIVPLSWSAAWSEEHNANICVARDMTEILATEDRLRQAQKLEAVGRLTGGVAHDFNNLLTVIICSAESLARENLGNPAVLELADMIRAAGERGSELTGQLLAFARRQPLDPRPVQANELVGGMEGLLRRTLGEHIELGMVLDDQAWPAMADPVQLESAVLNLAINARDAMPSGGNLTIETLKVSLDQASCDVNDDIQPGDYVMLAVTDSGEGMSPETVRQAFEPFFTTKAIGKGSGLGLSMVHGFVKQSKGNVQIYSELGIGTTVKVFLPRADSAVAPPERVLDEQELPLGTEHILLVEDNEMLRELARKQLMKLGYRVSCATNGPKALEMLEAIGDFDLLFTDMVMPGGLNGRQLADRIRVLRPGLKVLYTSGYTENAIANHGRPDEGIDLLNKPYRKRDLALKLRKVLDE